jgi:hypothetical protein
MSIIANIALRACTSEITTNISFIFLSKKLRLKGGRWILNNTSRTSLQMVFPGLNKNSLELVIDKSVFQSRQDV